MAFTCDICSLTKEEHQFYRTDGSFLRCKLCCKVTQFCDKCKIPKLTSHFKGKTKTCFDCRNGIFQQAKRQRSDTRTDPDYVTLALENHTKWLSELGIQQNGIHS